MKKKTKQTPEHEELGMGIRKALLLQTNGPIDAQKDALVDEIISVFSQPEKWPMTDGDRIALLKRLYSRAVRIRTTERA